MPASTLDAIIFLRLPRALKRALQTRAEKEHLTLTALVRQMLYEKVG